jgi:hypothetical protein
MNPTTVSGQGSGTGAVRLAAPVVSYPSWMDARYMLAACKVSEPKRVDFGADQKGTIPGNPSRWALFIALGAGVGFLQMSPWPQPNLFPLYFAQAGIPIPPFTLFEWGPLVAYEWNLFGSNLTSLLWSEATTY